MSSDNRKQYETAAVLDQDLLDQCHDNLTCNLEMVVEIGTPTGTLYLSDRNKYVGERFYEARTSFPIIKRTVGEFLSPTVEFSSLQIEINNADGKYNDILPTGANFDGWVGKTVEVKIGLRDVAATYSTLFKGSITPEGGFTRGLKSFTVVARDDFEKVNTKFPIKAFTTTAFPDLEPDIENQIIPVVYGDWTTDVEPLVASVPAIVVNGNDGDVNGENEPVSRTNLQLVISDNDNTVFDTTQVYLKRSDKWWRIPAADINTVAAGKNSFQIDQEATDLVNIAPSDNTEIIKLEYSRGDEFYVKVRGKDLGAYDDNIISQAKDILTTYGGVTAGEFHANWDTYRDKASPAESAIATYKSRIWIQEQESVLEYALSMLEQVRLEAFIDRTLKLKIFSMHFDDLTPSPGHELKNWDIERESFTPKIDERNNFNRAKAAFNYLPNRKENFGETNIFKNQAAITQSGVAAGKKVVFPNLVDKSAAQLQLIEILKLTSANLENVYANTTWRSLLLDIGDFLSVDVKLQSTEFDNVPAVIREIGVDPDGLKIPIRLFSFQMTPFPGYEPGFSGTVGGYNATITEET